MERSGLAFVFFAVTVWKGVEDIDEDLFRPCEFVELLKTKTFCLLSRSWLERDDDLLRRVRSGPSSADGRNFSSEEVSFDDDDNLRRARATFSMGTTAGGKAFRTRKDFRLWVVSTTVDRAMSR
jgi:hypothetical protein